MAKNTNHADGWTTAEIKAYDKHEAEQAEKAYMRRYPYEKYHTERIEWFGWPNGNVTMKFYRLTRKSDF